MLLECDYLKHFKECLDGINSFIHQADSRTKEHEYLISFRQDAYEILLLMPVLVLNAVHPDRLSQRLANLSGEEIEGFRQYVLRRCPDLLHVVDMLPNVSESEPLRDEVVLLDKLLSGFPLMIDRYRFMEVSWKYLPLLNWRRIEILDGICRDDGKGVTLADCYRSAFLRLPECDQTRSLLWLQYKMNPEKWISFRSELMDGRYPMIESDDRIIIDAWKRAMDFN
ncbi:hypothetical protein JW823_06920 [bacterium]|nr:hypothetical protein [candidate division CSSED10-310 bacterium]